jgi:hypothetical protein
LQLPQLLRQLLLSDAGAAAFCRLLHSNYLQEKQQLWY